MAAKQRPLDNSPVTIEYVQIPVSENNVQNKIVKINFHILLDDIDDVLWISNDFLLRQHNLTAT